MVLEYGEIDLAGMLDAKRKERLSNNETDLDENWLRFYWQVLVSHVVFFVSPVHTFRVKKKLLPFFETFMWLLIFAELTYGFICDFDELSLGF